MVLKVWQKRSLYFLIHYNSWTIYLLFVVLCSVDWDVFITRYNISHAQENGLDTYFLVYEVSDKNLYLLSKHIDDIERLSDGYFGNEFSTRLDQKWSDFAKQQQTYSWLSWNYADWRNWEYYQKR